MSAKIKDHRDMSRSHKHKPKGISDRAFERVYWPFIPVILAIALLLPMVANTGSLARMIADPIGRVLSYSASQDPQATLAETNRERLRNGRPELVLDSRLSAAAAAKAADMANRGYWSHNTPEGTPPWSFVSSTGYAYQKLGENLAAGFIDERSAVKAWMASPPHRENLLDESYTEVGFGFANVADYRAAGGGPMTIVVAYYGLPTGAIPAPKATSPTAAAPSTDRQNLPPTLASQTFRSQLTFNTADMAAWAPVAVIIAILTVTGLLIGKHIRLVRRAVRSGESFVWHHPLFDLGLLILAGLLFILAQTAGYIQ